MKLLKIIINHWNKVGEGIRKRGYGASVDAIILMNHLCLIYLEELVDVAFDVLELTIDVQLDPFLLESYPALLAFPGKCIEQIQDHSTYLILAQPKSKIFD